MPKEITLAINGVQIRVPEGTSLAAAIALAGIACFHRSPGHEPRGPLCGMGICFECRVTVDGQPHCRSCVTLCRQGMEVRTDE